VTGTALHLIKPLGFDTDEKAIRRSGLDYWRELDVRYYENFEEFIYINELKNGDRLYMATTKAKNIYSDMSFSKNDFIMFGKESAGIPEEILVEYPRSAIRIPMLENKRSINLSNSVAIVLYEALRQNSFPGLKKTGGLHRLSWPLT
jgi:tRNA (cytidine/uridine-2'-O-)-methyltransferase